MTATATPARALPRLWAVLVAGLLGVSLGLGLAVSHGPTDPNLHGMVGVLAAGLAVASHVRQGRGCDFLAVLGLVGAVGLGVMAQAGSVTPGLHLAAAVPAALLSIGLHLKRVLPAAPTVGAEP